MDLNYLYHRRGESLVMAERASSAEARTAHLGLAAGYADSIARARREQRNAAA
jgi:hypothetical protein